MCLPSSSARFLSDLCSRQRLRFSFTSRMPTVIWVGRNDMTGMGLTKGSRTFAMAILPKRLDRGFKGSTMTWRRGRQNAGCKLAGCFKPVVDHVDVTSTFTVSGTLPVLEGRGRRLRTNSSENPAAHQLG